MPLSARDRIRQATIEDSTQLVRLWQLVFDEADPIGHGPWSGNAVAWFARVVGDSSAAHFPLIEVDGTIVATAIGTLELGVPNPHSPRGRTVRLANVITLPEHRGN